MFAFCTKLVVLYILVLLPRYLRKPLDLLAGRFEIASAGYPATFEQINPDKLRCFYQRYKREINISKSKLEFSMKPRSENPHWPPVCVVGRVANVLRAQAQGTAL